MVNAGKGIRLYLRPSRGNEKAVWVIREAGKTKSTGCAPADTTGAERFLQEYLRNANEVNYDFLYSRLHLAKRRALAKGRDFDLKVSDLRELGEKQGWRCALTGLSFDLQTGEAWARPRALAIDRIDSRKGYVKENVRLVVHAINVAIGPWGEDEFASIAARFLAHRTSRMRQLVYEPVISSKDDDLLPSSEREISQ